MTILLPMKAKNIKITNVFNCTVTQLIFFLPEDDCIVENACNLI